MLDLIVDLAEALLAGFAGCDGVDALGDATEAAEDIFW